MAMVGRADLANPAAYFCVHRSRQQSDLLAKSPVLTEQVDEKVWICNITHTKLLELVLI